MSQEDRPDAKFEQRISMERALWNEKYFVHRYLAPEFKHGEFSANFSSSPEYGPIGELAGDLRGKRVLDCGCGDGVNSIQMALSGAAVVAIDVSEETGPLLEKKAAFNGVSDRVEFHPMPMEKLGFSDCEFDFVFGKAILHHTIVEKALKEVFRVLKPGGRFGFIEPMGNNPLINMGRKYMVVVRKEVYGNDVPFRLAALNKLREDFPGLEYKTFEILAALRFLRKMFPAIAGTSPARVMTKFLISHRVYLFDDYLMRRFPFMRRFARIVVITGVKG